MEPVVPHHFVPWLRTVAPHIHAHKGKTFVIGIAGELIAAGALSHLVQDLALIHSLGIRIVLAHGFRPQLADQLQAQNHTSQFSNGVRITDDVTLACAQKAAGQLRYQIEATFSQGLPNTPMAHTQIRVISGNYITAKPMGIVDGVDFEHTGVVRKLDSTGIQSALDQSAIVLLSPFGFSPTGQAFNLAMEDVAVQTATALKADKLVFITEVLGIPQSEHDQLPLSAPVLSADTINSKSGQAAIERQMTLKLASSLLEKLPRPQCPTDTAFYLKPAVKASQNGIERVHIIPFTIDGSLLIEVFTHNGIGTLIVNEKLDCLREAKPDDVGSIAQLFEPLEKEGVLLKRSRTDIERDLPAYTVVEHDGVLFGCAALFPYLKDKTAEMAALTVSSHGQGDGDKLLKHIEQRAQSLGCESIFVLTTQTMHWFIKRGFKPVEPEWLPADKLKKYNWERRSQVLVKKLNKVRHCI